MSDQRHCNWPDASIPRVASSELKLEWKRLLRSKKNSLLAGTSNCALFPAYEQQGKNMIFESRKKLYFFFEACYLRNSFQLGHRQFPFISILFFI